MTELRSELPELPPRMTRLPVDKRGYPVPWFVAWIDGEPDFRVTRPNGIAEAWRQNKCWLCGQTMGRYRSFVIGPMCAVNRTSAEPPCHLDCATFAAIACPFLARPHARRRENGMPEEVLEPDGIMLARNPGACAVWTTPVRKIHVRRGINLFDIGDPDHVEWYCRGRKATLEEVTASIDSGLPYLQELAEEDGPMAELALDAQVAKARSLVEATV